MNDHSMHDSYLTEKLGIRTWLFTTDHKRVALLFLSSATLFFLIGGLLAALIRLELLTPQADLVQSDTYNKLFTMHGVIMVFFFLLPSIPAVLGNFLLPLMLGARSLAFPRLSLASWYAFCLGGLLVLWAAVTGGVDTGWTFLPPYSSEYSPTRVGLTALGIAVAGCSSILTGLNLVITVHRARAPGLTWLRLPLFVWAHYATGLVMVLVSPIGIGLFGLLAAQQLTGAPVLDAVLGTDPQRFQAVFWIYAHPIVYVMILPAIGVVSELITTFSRKRTSNYGSMVICFFAMAVFTCLGWGRHLFSSGQPIHDSMMFSLIGGLAIIPAVIVIANWIATLSKGSISFPTPMLYALGFVGVFAVSEVTGLFLAFLPLGALLNGTYFAVAQFHMVVVGGVMMAYLGGLHFWWPKITGRMYPELWGRITAGVVFTGLGLTFVPQFLLGSLGMPSRYHVYADEFQVLNVMSTAGASILGLGYLIPVVYLVWALRYGKRAVPDPWRAPGLEWKTSSPPPSDNFGEQPEVGPDPCSDHAARESTGHTPTAGAPDWR